MKLSGILAAMAACVFATLLMAGPASAQATRTWVSGVGDDANPCSRTAPCKTFAGAISKTAAGGEIDCLDPGGFGGVTITKALTIDCQAPGGIGGVLVAGSNGIVVSAGSSDNVVLTGLDFEGVGITLDAVKFVSGQSLVLSNCIIRDFSQNGVNMAPTLAGTSSLFVENCMITHNGTVGQTFAGVQVNPASGVSVNFTVDNSQIINGVFGVIANGTTTNGKILGVVRNSNVSTNSQNGVTTSGGVAPADTVLLDNVTVADNGNFGLSAAGAATGMLVQNSSIFGNVGGGVKTANSGVVSSYGNNRLNGNNGNDGAFTGTVALH